MPKQKFSIDQQIQHMQSKGIVFNLIPTDKAKDYIREHNYYFRIKSYAKNYAKYSQTQRQGQYINLDFAYLKELSIIDLYLRRILLRMTIDIEHSLKVIFLDEVLNNSSHDGYTLVQQFLSSQDGQNSNKYLNKMHTYYVNSNKARSYTSNLFLKYHPSYPVWCLVELLTFGDFIRLYSYYYKSLCKAKPPFGDLLWATRIIRNAAAHNNCLLNCLSQKKVTQVSNTLRAVLKKNQHMNPLYLKYKNNHLIMDILSVYYLFCEIVKNEDSFLSVHTELSKPIVDRVFKNSYFKKNTEIRECFELLQLALTHIKQKSKYKN